jgi:excisionase family DNA binding protein
MSDAKKALRRQRDTRSTKARAVPNKKAAAEKAPRQAKTTASPLPAQTNVLTDELTVTVEKAAVLLGLSRNSAYSAVREGSIPSIRIGRCIRVPSALLREMLGIRA